jgi:hypothetical protein
MVPLTPETLPADWIGLRDQWEYGHAARAVLQIIALGALVFSVLIEIPTNAPKDGAGLVLRSTDRVKMRHAG